MQGYCGMYYISLHGFYVVHVMHDWLLLEASETFEKSQITYASPDSWRTASNCPKLIDLSTLISTGTSLHPTV